MYLLEWLHTHLFGLFCSVGAVLNIAKEIVSILPRSLPVDYLPFYWIGCFSCSSFARVCH